MTVSLAQALPRRASTRGQGVASPADAGAGGAGRPHEGRSRIPAWLIGSLAWGGSGERSDVDIVLGGASREEAATLELELATPLRLPVDVLCLEELPASFRARVEQEGVRLDGR